MGFSPIFLFILSDAMWWSTSLTGKCSWKLLEFVRTLFSFGDRLWFVKGPGTENMDYYELADMMAERFGLDPDIFRRQITQESGFREDAVSEAGAIGLGQVMPATAAQPGYGVTPLAADLMMDPEENLRFSAEYMRAMLDENDGDYGLALAAYNAGQGAVNDAGGIPDFEETRNYVNIILGSGSDAPLRPQARPGPLRPQARPEDSAGLRALVGGESPELPLLDGLFNAPEAAPIAPELSRNVLRRFQSDGGRSPMDRFQGLGSLGRR